MNQVYLRSAILAAGAFLLTLSSTSQASAQDTAAADAADATATPAAVAPLSESATLRPGEFVWQPERATQGAVEVVVSIPQQRAYIYRGETLIGVTTVSTGRPGHSTPTGTFNILEKRREHYSNLYNNAPMPFMQRLTWGGVALHAGHIPGTPASHGCVRLPLAFARSLFSVTSVGAAVHITDRAPTTTTALAMVRPIGTFTGQGGPIVDVRTGGTD